MSNFEITLRQYYVRKATSKRFTSPLSADAKHTFFVIPTSSIKCIDFDRTNDLFKDLVALNVSNMHSFILPYADNNQLLEHVFEYDKIEYDKFCMCVDKLESYHLNTNRTTDETKEATVAVSDLANFVGSAKSLHASLLFGMSDVFNNAVLSDKIEFTCSSHDELDTLRVFCGVHNSLALTKMQSAAAKTQNDNSVHSILTTLKNRMAAHKQRANLAETQIILWQSLIINPMASTLTDYLHTALFGDGMKHAMKLFSSDGDFNDSILTSSALYFPQHLIARKPIVSNPQLKCIAGEPYWTADTNIEIKTDSSMISTTMPNSIIESDILKSDNAQYVDRAIITSAGPADKIANTIVLAAHHIMPGQAVAWMSNYGTQIDLVLKQFMELYIMHTTMPTELLLEKQSALRYFMANMPELVFVCARIALTRMLHTYVPSDDSGSMLQGESTYIDESQPGFLFSMVYSGGNVIGIHADTIIRVDNSTLIVGELKTKWALTKKSLKKHRNFLTEIVEASTYNDHVHQALCQGIVAYCMHGRGVSQLKVHLYAIAVPYETDVPDVYDNSVLCTLEDADVSNLCCKLYASLLFSAVCLRNQDTFKGFADKTYFIPRNSSIMLWVIAALTLPEESIVPIYMLDLQGEATTLARPTFARIVKETDDSTSSLNVWRPAFLIPLASEERTWCLPLSCSTNNTTTEYKFCVLLPTGVKKDSTIKNAVIANAAIATLTVSKKSKEKPKERITYADTYAIVLITVKSSEKDLEPGSLMCNNNSILMLPSLQTPGSYNGVFLNNADRSVEVSSLQSWFRTFRAANNNVYAAYDSLFTAGKLKTVFTSCSLVSVHGIVQACIKATVQMTNDSQLKLDHVRFFLQMFCSDKNFKLFGNEWPFNICQTIATNSITLFNPGTTALPNSVLAPIENNGVITYHIFTRTQKGTYTQPKNLKHLPFQFYARSDNVKEIDSEELREIQGRPHLLRLGLTGVEPSFVVFGDDKNKYLKAKTPAFIYHRYKPNYYEIVDTSTLSKPLPTTSTPEFPFHENNESDLKFVRELRNTLPVYTFVQS